MTEETRQPVYAAAIIERPDHHVLIALPRDEDGEERRWCFPYGLVAEGEPPEAALRRIARAELGIELEIDLGQPPIPAEIDGRQCVLRFFLCHIVTGEPESSAYTETRWVVVGQLPEYHYDPVSQGVVDWLREA